MKKLSLFILTCLLSTSWAWADTSVTEKFTRVVQNGSSGATGSNWTGDVCNWETKFARRGTNDKVKDNSQFTWLTLNETTRGYIKTTNLEGGIKDVAFNYAQFGAEAGKLLRWQVSTIGASTTSDVIERDGDEGENKSTSNGIAYSHTFGCKSNAQLEILNMSVLDDGNQPTSNARLLVGNVTITPYLLYRNKDITIGSRQQGYYNDELIDNTGGEGTITYSSSATSVATIDSESGVIIPVAAGTTTITATWSEGASTTYTLHVVDDIIAENFSKVVQTGQTASAIWHGDLFDWSVANVRRGVDDTLGLAPRIQATALRSNTGSTITSVKAIEGGVKHVSFDWRQWGSGSGTLNMNMYYSSDPANWGEAVATQSVDAVGASEPHVFDMDIDDGTKGNAYLKLQYTSDAGVAVMGAMKITPYLLYTTKSHTLDTRVDELTYTNTGLINNTSGEAVAYTISPDDEGASIDSSTGAVTVTDETEGDFTVTATWGAVTTTYTLTVLSRTATTASYAEAAKRVGLDALAIGNPLTYTDGYDGTITYTSSNTAVATVNAAGTVALAGGVGQTTITATLSQTADFKAASASYTLYVTDNSSNVLVEAFSAVPTGNAGAHAGQLWKGDVCDWRVSASGGVRKNNDVFASDQTRSGIWMGTPDPNTTYGSLTTENSIEGGIQHLWFYCEQPFNTGEAGYTLKPVVYLNEAIEANKVGEVEIAGTSGVDNIAANRTLFGASNVSKSNSVLIIQNESYQTEGGARPAANSNRGRFLLDEIHITPYLLYTDKTEKTATVGGTYTNTALINNTTGESGILSYSSSNTSVAMVDGEGQVTGVAEGYAVITAKFAWSESEYVTTSYPIYVAPASNCETFNTACTDNFYATNNDVVGDVTTWSTVLGGINTNENVEPYAAFFRAKRDSEENFGSITSGTINGGISQLSFYWNIAVAEETDVNKWDIRVFINDREVKQLTNETGHELDGITGHQASMTKCTITDIDEPGNFVIRFENRTTMTDSYTSGNKGRFVIDNVFWESYDAPIFLDETADNTALIRRNSGATTDVNTDRSLVADVWNTLCMPFALSKFADLDNAEVQELSACTADGDALTVSFTEVVDDELEAGKPYLVKPSSNISLTGFTDKEITAVPQSITKGVITLRGIFSPVVLTGGDTNTLFVGSPNTSGNNLFYPLSDSSLKGMRAYFTIDAGAGAPLFRTARFVVEEKKLPTAVDDARGQEVTVEKLIEDGHVIIIRDGKRYNVLGAQE